MLKKSFILLLGIFLFTSLISASALISAPDSISKNTNFNLEMSGTFYALELTIPSGVTLISSTSVGGVLGTDNIYRITNTGVLTLIYTGSASSITFTGQYSDGSDGVLTLTPKTITINSEGSNSGSQNINGSNEINENQTIQDIVNNTSEKTGNFFKRIWDKITTFLKNIFYR